MASTYSPALRLELMATGDQSGTWGDTTNTNLGTLLEQAITGVLSVAEGDTTLTLTSNNGATDQARNAVVNLTGAMTGAHNVIVPTSNKLYLIKNSTTGGFATTVKTAAGTGVAVAAGTSQWVYCDGTNVVQGLIGGSAPDVNNNISANNFIEGYVTTATAGASTTLTVASPGLQFFTGTTTQTVVMPVASTLVLGQAWRIVNNSSGAVTVNSSGANAIIVLAAGAWATIECILISGTSAASWSAQYAGISAASGKLLTASNSLTLAGNDGKTLTVSNSLTLAGTDATVMTFPTTSATIARSDAANTFTGVQTFNTAVAVASGGTGRATLTLNNVLLGNGTTAVQQIAPSTSGNVLTSDGTTWASTAPASSGQPIPTSSTYAVGDTCYARVPSGSGTTADGATIAGTSLQTFVVQQQTSSIGIGTGLAMTGTWKNISGVTISGGAAGTPFNAVGRWVRTV